jgi:hypothetical protein
VQYPVEPFVITAEGVLTPPGRDRWVTEAMYRGVGSKPQYTLAEVAQVFFGRSSTWMRKKLAERKDRYQADRTEAGHRRFGLNHIEDLAHLFLEESLISPLQFAMTIRIIKACAILALYEIGDTGFLLDHWNGAQRERRVAITRVMEALESFDAGRPYTGQTELEKSVLEAALAIQHAEKLQEDR